MQKEEKKVVEEEKKKPELKKDTNLDPKEEELVFETSEDIEVYPTFQVMGLREELLRGIFRYGFDKPSAVQQRAIIPVVKGRDVIIQSQSGTGKTAVFCLGSLQILDMSLREPQILILSPTRELAEQSQKVALALGEFLNVQVHACIGGASVSEDIRRLEHGVHIVSGTPGIKIYSFLVMNFFP